MIYDRGVKNVPWCTTASEHPDFKSHRGAIERLFALIKMKFPMFFNGGRHGAADIARRWKICLVLVILNHLAEIDACRRQGISPPDSLFKAN